MYTVYLSNNMLHILCFEMGDRAGDGGCELEAGDTCGRCWSPTSDMDEVFEKADSAGETRPGESRDLSHTAGRLVH